MNKKGADLPLNVIIIAAIVLIVLVVLWAIFTGRMGVFSKGVTDVTKGQSCAEAGGQSKTEVQGCEEGCERIYGNFKDLGTGDICCRPTKVCSGATGCSSYSTQQTCTNAKNAQGVLLGCTWDVSTASC